MGRSASSSAAFIDVLVCPVCRMPLDRYQKVFVCDEGHSFDIAREGYVNLLIGKGSGDAPEMLAARRRVLDAGNYAAATGAVAEIIAAEADKAAPGRILLDAGCGEGHYLRRIVAKLDDVGGNRYRYIGLDSSRHAIKMAAGRSREPLFVVADVNRSLPFAKSAVAVLLSIFAPRNPAEFARVVAPRGALIVVIPQPNHLAALRSLAPMLGVEENKEEHLRDMLAPEFELESGQSIEWQMELSGEDVADLVRMTPNYWHLGPEDREKLSTTQMLSVEGCVRVLLFRRG